MTSIHPSVVSLFPPIIFIVALIFAVGSYVVNGLALFLMGRKAGISWAWVAWIPGAMNFVTAKMANWKSWALFPILTLVWAGIFVIVGMILMGLAAYVNTQHFSTLGSLSPMTPVYSVPPLIYPGILPVIMVVMSLIEGIAILFAVFTMIQWGQVLERFGYSYAWIMWNFLPVIGSVVFFIILLRIAFRKEVQYQAPEVRTVFGSKIKGSEI